MKTAAMGHVKKTSQEPWEMRRAVWSEVSSFATTPKPGKHPRKGSADARALERRLNEATGLKVRIEERGAGGRVVITYATLADFDRLFTRLEDEYGLQERRLAIDRKLELISRTVETLVDLLQNQRALRVEWYIVLLIVFEIFLTLYQLFVVGGH